jgi:SAM-dependent MidA family methyltransferase
VTRLWREDAEGGELEYVTVDASPELRARQADVPGVRAVASTRDLDADGTPTLVFGNEVLDALPVRRVMGARDGGLLELHVDVSESTGRFRERLLPVEDAALDARFTRLGLRPQQGQLVEVAPALEAFVRDAARLASPGFLCFVDYGDPAPVLYAPTRINGTLRAYRAHGRFFDPYERVGEQDLTADVDFTTVTHAAEDAGMEALGYTSQGEWLEALGVGDLGTDEEIRMVAGAANLGTAFHVLLFRRGTRAALPGFG